MDKKHQLTSEGLEAIKAKLKKLKEVDRPANVEALKEARAQGDLSENAEYDAARDEQARIENEISELEEIVRNAVVIEDENHSNNLGKLITIEYEDDHEVEEFLLVSSSLEADPMQGKISKESPLGKAVLEASVGEIVKVKPDTGEHFHIVVKNIKESK